MQKINVSFNDDGKNLITFLSSKYPSLTVNIFYKALRKKDIKINGKRINENITIYNGDVIELYISDDILFNNTLNQKDIPIVFEDENIVVFNKPTNIEVDGKNSLTELMKDRFDYLEPCHRIDRNTIGLVLFAKNEKALNIIIDKFKNFEIEKHYIACCYGIPKSNKTLIAYHFKDSKKKLVYISKTPKKGYSKIQTSYKIIDINESKKLCLLDVTLHTGKTHQIRSHLAFEGLPILGDGKYGSYEINKKYKVSSQLLCSYSITFKSSEDDNLLNYLNDKTIQLKRIPFKNYLQ